MDRTRADHMGMLATAINALGVCDALEQLGLTVRVQTAISMRQVAEPYIRNKAICHLESGKVVIFGCGTGNPFFSTDTAASLRAAEIEADVIMKATMVDGVYDSDPRVNPDAKKYDTVSIEEVIAKKLAVIDLTASIMCMENHMPMAVFSLNEENGIANAIRGKINGTTVTV
jgi:uridylate kinase